MPLLPRVELNFCSDCKVICRWRISMLTVAITTMWLKNWRGVVWFELSNYIRSAQPCQFFLLQQQKLGKTFPSYLWKLTGKNWLECFWSIRRWIDGSQSPETPCPNSRKWEGGTPGPTPLSHFLPEFPGIRAGYSSGSKSSIDNQP